MPDAGHDIAVPSRARPAHWWSLGGNFCWAASLFLTGLSAKLALILGHGMVFPYLDQWPGEAEATLLPYLTGKLTVATLFAPQNEHRIFFTRATELLLLVLNGQWDSLLEMTFNAGFYCAGLAAFGWALASMLGRRSWPVVWVILTADLAAPFAWENTAWAYQSQFYFLIVFSLATLWLLGLGEPWSWRWWLGLVAALSAFFSMASGFLAAAVAAGMSVFLVWKRREDWRRHAPTWVFCAALIFAGWHFRIHVPGHERFMPQSARYFAMSLGRELAWPWSTAAWYAPINLVPLLVLGWLCVRSAEPPKIAEVTVLAIGGWALLQALAMTYARGYKGGVPAFRYMDILSFLAIANCLSIYLILTKAVRWRIPRGWIYAGAAMWMMGCASGLYDISRVVCQRILPQVDETQAVALAAAREFVVSDDPAVFDAVPPPLRQYPTEYNVRLFRDPNLRKILPVYFREPLHAAPGTNLNSAFIRNGWPANLDTTPPERGWGSYTDKRKAPRGSFETGAIEPSRFPYLDLAVAGDLGEEGFSLTLVELNNGKETAVEPVKEPGDAWLHVQVRAPRGPFKMVAQEKSETGWFAFSEPVEMGRLSLWSLRAAERWGVWLVLGIGLLVLNLLNVARWRDPERAVKNDATSGAPEDGAG